MDLIAIHNGRILHLVRSEAYTRKDGSASALAVWRTTCRTCGAAYEITTAAGIHALLSSKSFGTVNCPAHRARRKPKAGASACNVPAANHPTVKDIAP